MRCESDLLAAERHLLPPGSEVFLSGDHTLVLRSSTGTTAFSGDLVGAELVECIRSLDGTRTLRQVLAAIDPARREACVAFVHELAQRRLLALELPLDNQPSPDDPHAAAYWRLYADSAEGAKRRLQNATVLVAGLGGIGATLASALAAAGIVRLLLIDAHPVRAADASLGYRCLARDQSRASALAETLREHADTSVEPIARRVEENEWDQMVASAQLVVMTSDNMALADYERTNESCLRLGTPWTSARIDRQRGMIGPYIVPGQTACFACYELRVRANADHADDHAAMYRHWHELADCPPDWPLLPAATRMLGEQLALDTLRVIGGQQLSAAYGKVLHVELDTQLSRAHEVLKLPRCPACSRARNRPLTRIWDLNEAFATKAPDR